MGYRTVVVGTDGSASATEARDVAIRVARRFDAELVVICVIGGRGLTEQLARGVLGHAVDAATVKKVRATAELRSGDPHDALLAACVDHGADLLVVGNRGLDAATRFRLGGVPDRVTHEAPCDVLVVDTAGDTGSEGPRYRHAIAGTDGSATASAACLRAFDVATMFGAPVSLVFVGDPLVGKIRVEETARAGADDLQVEPLILPEGDPAQAIVDAAERVHADLVVVGNKGMSRRVFGSVPGRVLHAGVADVLVVKTIDRSAADIGPGHGAILDEGGKRVAVFRDDDGKTHRLNPRCTHMGCTVGWNDADRTWDCPCHGSRYATDGTVIHGPAQRSLEALDG
ncbi:MAG: universal stress protein [Actinomycetota bacterium]